MKTTSPEKAHAKFSPSGSDRWLECPGSIALSEKAPPEVEGPWAEEGTRAHSCLEDFFTMTKAGTSIKQCFVQLYKKYNDYAMVDHAGDAFKEISEMAPEGAEVLSESKIDISPFTTKGQFGTCDALIVQEFGKLSVIDFKYGAGVPVDVVDNTQLILYALGAAHRFDNNFSEVEMVIIQPRAEHASGNTTRTWLVTMDELLEWAPKFKAAAKLALKPNAALSAGDHCRWCRAKVICPEISTKAMSKAKVAFQEAEEDEGHPLLPVVQSVPFPATIPAASLGLTLRSADLLERWIAAVRERAENLLLNGHAVPGWKLVPKRGTRKYLDEKKAQKEAVKTFGPDILEPACLPSPAQLEAKLEAMDFEGKAWVSARTSMVSSGSTIAPEDDKRPAVKPTKGETSGKKKT